MQGVCQSRLNRSGGLLWIWVLSKSQSDRNIICKYIICLAQVASKWIIPMEIQKTVLSTITLPTFFIQTVYVIR